jgi:hypothetical protein
MAVDLPADEGAGLNDYAEIVVRAIGEPQAEAVFNERCHFERWHSIRIRHHRVGERPLLSF